MRTWTIPRLIGLALARLTIDLAAGDRWLIAITRKATADWLNGPSPLLDYANAMVPARQPSVRDAIAGGDAVPIVRRCLLSCRLSPRTVDKPLLAVTERRYPRGRS